MQPPTSTDAPPVSVRRKSPSGVRNVRAHAVRSAKRAVGSAAELTAAARSARSTGRPQTARVAVVAYEGVADHDETLAERGTPTPLCESRLARRRVEPECELVDIAPAPVLARLGRPRDRVGCLARMPRRVLVRRAVAAANRAAGHA